VLHSLASPSILDRSQLRSTSSSRSWLALGPHLHTPYVPNFVHYVKSSCGNSCAIFRTTSSLSRRSFIINMHLLHVNFTFRCPRLPPTNQCLPQTDQWLLVMSTQLIGYSISGLCKRFLVSPPSMIWPGNLVPAALFNTLHSKETTGIYGRSGISRERFFTYVVMVYFIYSQFSFSQTS
jgi:OPT oligopeptide transporter protein